MSLVSRSGNYSKPFSSLVGENPTSQHLVSDEYLGYHDLALREKITSLAVGSS
jgi:hypothetical protein